MNFFLFLVFALFALVIFRLFYLQIIHGKEYRQEGEDQYFYTTGDDFNRGSINLANKKDHKSSIIKYQNFIHLM
jgi:cell division protein FtsI/penicillin-binding protein 2